MGSALLSHPAHAVRALRRVWPRSVQRVRRHLSMRIVCIADTHGAHEDLRLPSGELLVCAGDVTTYGTLEEFANCARWLHDQAHPHKLLIAGNHDDCLHHDATQALRILQEDAPS